MQSPSGFNPAADMIVKRIIVAASVLCLGAVLGSCSPFSGYVADHWPRWAGGMPEDVPPRPGAPGYDEFVAHGQADTDATKPAASGVQPAAPAAKAKAQVAPAAQVTPSSGAPADDPSTVRGGLY
jgi:hypothetical protein